MRKPAAALLAITLFATCPACPAVAAADTTLRVCVLKDAAAFDLTIRGRYRIFTLKTDEPLYEGEGLDATTVFPTPSGLSVGDKKYDIFGIKVVPRKGSSVYIGKRSFRGKLDIIRTEKERLLAINHVGLEDYLKGVLYHEVSHWWPIEAIKAQAIASRTYALYRKTVSVYKDYDLTDDIYSQVYGGRNSERIRTNIAVNSTKGKVLTYKGKIFPSYYHATCGGRTEDDSNVWDSDLAVLKSVKCNFCALSPHRRWKRRVTVSSVEDALVAAGYDARDLKTLRTRGKTRSGRVRDVEAFSNTKFTIPAVNFRMAVGPNIIRSTDFNIRKSGDSFIFRGRGWGHGVGMCQWGAFFLGLRRYKAAHILRYYYPDSRIVKMGHPS